MIMERWRIWRDKETRSWKSLRVLFIVLFSPRSPVYRKIKENKSYNIFIENPTMPIRFEVGHNKLMLTKLTTCLFQNKFKTGPLPGMLVVKSAFAIGSNCNFWFDIGFMSSRGARNSPGARASIDAQTPGSVRPWSPACLVVGRDRAGADHF